MSVSAFAAFVAFVPAAPSRHAAWGVAITSTHVTLLARFFEAISGTTA